MVKWPTACPFARTQFQARDLLLHMPVESCGHLKLETFSLTKFKCERRRKTNVNPGTLVHYSYFLNLATLTVVFNRILFHMSNNSMILLALSAIRDTDANFIR